MQIKELFNLAFKLGASDVHLSAGSPPAFRLHGELLPLGAPEWREKYNLDPGPGKILNRYDMEKFCREIMSEDQYEKFIRTGEYDFSFSLPDVGRFRINVFKQRGTVAMAARLISSRIYSFKELGLPETLTELVRKSRGLVLVTGPTGSGKSTTLASMIDVINSNYRRHIITLEDPIEFIHTNKKSIINQREIGNDSRSFASALRAALREDPDVILVGEMRDPETIGIAITAAETGHLVLATLHTSGATQTIDRIIDVFPPHQQQQIRVQLADTLQGIVAQQLIPRADRPGRVAAVEIMTVTPAISNLIREGKTHQIVSHIQTGARFGMQTLDMTLYRLYKNNIISKEEVLARTSNPQAFTRKF